MFLNNQLYRLNKEWAEHYSQADEFNPSGIKYEFAKSTSYAGGAYIADCWIMNTEGNVHPGYNSSPVPLNISALEIVETEE